MTAPEKVIGFDEDCEHVLCERCCKDGKVCCEKDQRDCEECGGSGNLDEDGPVDDEWERWDLMRACEACDGRGWCCSCDENGNHARKQP